MEDGVLWASKAVVAGWEVDASNRRIPPAASLKKSMADAINRFLLWLSICPTAVYFCSLICRLDNQSHNESILGQFRSVPLELGTIHPKPVSLLSGAHAFRLCRGHNYQ